MVVGAFSFGFCDVWMEGFGARRVLKIIKRKIWKHGMQKEELRRLLKFGPAMLVRGLVNFVC